MLKDRILVVDPTKDTFEFLNSNIGINGYNVNYVTSGEEAIEIVRSNPIDLIIIELILNGIDGFDVCRILKNDYRTSHIPIVIQTSKDNEIDIVTGLELGADDYITKPINPRILLAKIRALLRRLHELDTRNVYTYHNISLNVITREVRVDQETVILTPTEYNILFLLLRRPGWIFTRKHIIDTLKGNDHTATDRLIDVLIVGLRKKLGLAGKLIETVRGEGYRLKERKFVTL